MSGEKPAASERHDAVWKSDESVVQGSGDFIGAYPHRRGLFGGPGGVTSRCPVGAKTLPGEMPGRAPSSPAPGSWQNARADGWPGKYCGSPLLHSARCTLVSAATRKPVFWRLFPVNGCSRSGCCRRSPSWPPLAGAAAQSASPSGDRQSPWWVLRLRSMASAEADPRRCRRTRY